VTKRQELKNKNAEIDVLYYQELNMKNSDAMFPVNVELVNLLWLPNVYIYNLKTFKVEF